MSFLLNYSSGLESVEMMRAATEIRQNCLVEDLEYR
jgi:hypothetical protein